MSSEFDHHSIVTLSCIHANNNKNNIEADKLTGRQTHTVICHSTADV